jgi:hypothetical protein
MNINPQSNTDFTQVMCTVHFYYTKKIHLLSILLMDNLIVTGEQITDTVYCQKHYMDKMPKSPKV